MIATEMPPELSKEALEGIATKLRREDRVAGEGSSSANVRGTRTGCKRAKALSQQR